MFLINKKVLQVLFLATLVLLLGFSVFKFYFGPIIETNILSLLPKKQNSDIVKFSEEKFTQNIQRKIIILIGHTSGENASSAAREFESLLDKTELFSEVTSSIDSDGMQPLLNFYKTYHYTLLSKRQRKILTEDNINSIRNHVLSKVYGLSFDMALVDMKVDPLFLFQDYLSETMGQTIGRFNLVDGVPIISYEGKFYAVINAELSESSFSIDYQQKVIDVLNQSQNVINHNKEGLSFIRSGLLFHTFHGANIAKNEINKIGSISLLAVFLLLTFTFKSLKPFFVTIGSIIIGGLMGSAVCLLIFGKVHLLTLVFGTSLIGISIDYAIHFFAERYNNDFWDSNRSLTNIFSCITLGVITSSVGFLGLCFTPFPGLQQMAIFCITGLISVYICVVLFYPKIFSSMNHHPNQYIYKIVSIYLKFWNKKRISLARKILTLLVILLLGSIPFLEGRDDVRAMQSLSPELIANDLVTATMLGSPSASQFFVVIGSSEDEVLERLEGVSSSLDVLKKSGVLDGYHTLSDYIPSKMEQNANLKLLQSFVNKNKIELKNLFNEIGLPDTIYDNYVAYLSSKKDHIFSIQDVFLIAGSEDLSLLYQGDVNGKIASLVTLKGIKDFGRLRHIAEGQDNIIFVDKVASFSDLLNNYRYHSLLWAIAAFSVIYVILVRRYGILQGAFILAPSLLASLMALGLVVLIEGSYSLFHVLALFLVTGIGVDYGLFLAEPNKDRKLAMVAIFLSAMTTLLSFSLLMMSSTSALRDFGFTIAVGIAITFLLSPVALSENDKKAVLNVKF